MRHEEYVNTIETIENMPFYYKMERVKGIEPSYSAWKAAALPLSYTRDICTLQQYAGKAKWWRGLDLNQRRANPADLQSAAIDRSATSPDTFRAFKVRGVALKGKSALCQRGSWLQGGMKRPFRPNLPARPPQSRRGGEAEPVKAGRVILYGRHAVSAALVNPARRLRRLNATQRALEPFQTGQLLPAELDVQICDEARLGRLLGPDVPHQGLALEVDMLADISINDVLEAGNTGPLIMLDQVTDPQNFGAILRSAAAFGAAAVISQDRHSPSETGALAKAASGTLEIMPWCKVVNLSRALETIGESGYWRIGLTGHAAQDLAASFNGSKVCLVLGAEGAGLRPNVADHTDVLARLPISARVESLNVSTAAAVALYAAVNQEKK
jgi:23S rRNA (guanosine2251-2'-O)-methyltransferase